MQDGRIGELGVTARDIPRIREPAFGTGPLQDEESSWFDLGLGGWVGGDTCIRHEARLHTWPQIELAWVEDEGGGGEAGILLVSS